MNLISIVILAAVLVLFSFTVLFLVKKNRRKDSCEGCRSEACAGCPFKK